MDVKPIAKRLIGGKIDFATAATFVVGVFELVEDINVIAGDLKGADKLEAVKAGAWTLAQELHIDDDFERIWRKVGPYISLIVKVLKLKSLLGPATPSAPPPHTPVG